MKKFGCLFLALAFVNFNCFSRTGGWTSGGGEEVTDQNNPWFFGKKPIEYCVEVGENFPIAQDRVKEIINDSFLEWKRILKGYELDNYVISVLGRELGGLSLNSEYREVCDDLDHQIIFKIGVIDKLVKDFLNGRSEIAIGYAFRKKYDHKTYRTGGFIWVAPQGYVGKYNHPIRLLENFPKYNNENQFRALILHELSHIYGIPGLKGFGTGPLSENIIIQIGQDQWSVEEGNGSHIDIDIENNERRLNPSFSTIRNPIIYTNDQNDSLEDMWNNLLQELGHNLKKDPWKRTEVSISNLLSIEGLKIILKTQSGKKFQLSSRFVIDDQSEMFNSRKGIQFYSKNISDRRIKRISLLDMKYFFNPYFGVLRILDKKYVIRFNFTHGFLGLTMAKVDGPFYGYGSKWLEKEK